MPPRARFSTTVLAATVALVAATPAGAPRVPRVPAVRAVGTQLVLAGRPFRAYGFNYVFAASHPNIDYLAAPTPAGLRRIRTDFATAARLGANTVRIFVPIWAIMQSPTAVHRPALAALGRTLAAAWEAGLRVDVTGGTTWHLERLPAWYDALSEADRWAVDERFWAAVAEVGARAPNVLMYELTSEPAVGDFDSWYVGTMPGDDHHFLRVLVRELRGRDPVALARQWTQRMRDAVRSRDRTRLISIGLLPLGTVFDPANLADLLDVITVHVYPTREDLEGTLEIVRQFAAQGRPLVLGETFAMDRAAEEAFLISARHKLDGALTFFDGRAPEQVRPTSAAERAYRENLITFLGLRNALLRPASPRVDEPVAGRRPVGQ